MRLSSRADTEMEEKRDRQRGHGDRKLWVEGMSWFAGKKSYGLHRSVNFIPEIPGFPLGSKLDVIVILGFFGFLFFGHLDTNWVILAEDASL